LSPTADVETGTPNLNPEKTRFGRNRNLKIPARTQDEQSVAKNQGRAFRKSTVSPALTWSASAMLRQIHLAGQQGRERHTHVSLQPGFP
jgi:hypothetical protein